MIKLILKIAFILILLLIIYGVAYLYFNPQFGGRINSSLKEQYSRSAQWDGEKFVNESVTEMEVNLKTLPGLLKEQFKDRVERAPSNQFPMLAFDRKSWDRDTADFKFIWFGHSVGLMKINNLNILIDPMFGPDASPIGPFRTNRYTDSTLFIIDQLPPIDAVVITHDHYDHLDYESFLKLINKVSMYYVPLGVKRHLLRWGVEDQLIREFDWWESAQMGGVEMTFVPSRHFSGRGLMDRAESLWGGWTFISSKSRVYWSGDGGYGTHFKKIGERLGPFDWAFVECGQYYKLWHSIHMYPEESVQAVMDVRGKVGIPIHWGAFTLSLHDWRDPVERFKEEARGKNVAIAMPELGEVITSLPKEASSEYWWEPLK